MSRYCIYKSLLTQIDSNTRFLQPTPFWSPALELPPAIPNKCMLEIVFKARPVVMINKILTNINIL